MVVDLCVACRVGLEGSRALPQTRLTPSTPSFTHTHTLSNAAGVGTQQQQQPGSSGTGCSFLFPILNSSCPTDPQVTVQNITFRNVSIYNALLSPGVLIANASNPGTGFVFDNVVVHNASTWPVTGYLVESVAGVATGGTDPVPQGWTMESP